MVKVTYSSDISSTVGVGGELVKSSSELRKQASTIFGVEYEAMKPPKGMTGIHLVALGEGETYGANRNKDWFGKEACIKYVDTFVKYGHVYEHHRNKDEKKALGQIKAAAYNPDMHRIELYIWADNEKSRDHIERLEKTGEVSFSMACNVKFDVCSICGNHRTCEKDACDHIAHHLGELYEDGREVYMDNTKPKWFDISFVGRPADRIAWNLKSAADLSDRGFEDDPRIYTEKSAAMHGYILPDELSIESERAVKKASVMKELADAHSKLRAWMTKSATPATREERTLFELRKAAGCSLSDSAISRLRELDTKDAFTALSDAGIVLDVPSFFKYAMGPRYHVVEPYMPEVARKVPEILDNAVKTASCASFCNDSMFDSRSLRDGMRRLIPSDVRKTLAKEAESCGMSTFDEGNRILDAIATGTVPEFIDFREKKASAVDETTENGVSSYASTKLAEKYISYSVSGITDVLGGACGTGLNRSHVMAMKAAQDFKRV